MKKEYILFDLDGTLTDSAPGIINSLIYALEKFDIHVDNRESLRVFIGPPLVDMMMQVFGFSKDTAEQALKFYREYFSEKGIFENSVYNGIEELLCGLKNDGYKLILATSKPELFAKRILEHFDLDKYFYFVGGSDMEGTRVSKDAVIKYVLSSLGIVDASSCIMVGDKEHDIIGARKCGIDCIGVLYGFGTKEELENANAAFIAETVDEVYTIIKSHF